MLLGTLVYFKIRICNTFSNFLLSVDEASNVVRKFTFSNFACFCAYESVTNGKQGMTEDDCVFGDVSRNFQVNIIYATLAGSEGTVLTPESRA